MKPHDTLPYTELPDYSDAERIARSEAFYQAIKSRRTCRYFTDEAIPRAVIENAIRAAGTAPNGANHQPWHFAVIETPEKKKALRAAAEEEERAFYESKGSEEWLEALAPLGTDADKPFLETAPYLIVIFGQRKGGMNPGEMKQNRQARSRRHDTGPRDDQETAGPDRQLAVNILSLQKSVRAEPVEAPSTQRALQVKVLRQARDERV